DFGDLQGLNYSKQVVQRTEDVDSLDGLSLELRRIIQISDDLVIGSMVAYDPSLLGSITT
ncbi:MAG: hypothetical protein P8Y98_09715, partial [Anaerolineales bacterium]